MEVETTKTKNNNQKLTLEQAFEEIRAVHGNRFSLTPDSKYINTNTKIELYCNVCNETFWITPKKCKSGQGHKKCARGEACITRTRPFSRLRAESDARFGKDVFVYDEDTYVNWNTPMSIWCRRHGNFRKPPVEHLATYYGCSKCGEESRGRPTQKRYSEIFEARANETHGGKYDYSKFEYIAAKVHGTIICPEHGEFTMTPDVHLGSKASGCPECGKRFGKAQKEVQDYVESLGLTCLSNHWPDNKLEIDIFIPELNIGIEYNGLRWHSDEFRSPYHLYEKSRHFSNIGIRIIHIYEDEWLYKENVVKDWLKTILGKQDVLYNARDLQFRPISWNEYKSIMDSTHLQGSGVVPTYKYGLCTETEVVAAMGFNGRECKDDEIELIRFCSKGSVRGGFSKLLKNALKDMPGNISTVVSFSDNRWSLGEVYSKNGFTHVKFVKPTYWYVNHSKRMDKRGFQRKYLAARFANFDENLSEKENCAANGWYRIFDCGKQRWELKL